MCVEILILTFFLKGGYMTKKNEGSVFDYINDQVNIIDVISSYITLERAGKNHKALCPFHNEKTPSFIVSEEKQLYHCFGCGAAGNAVSFVMHYENLDPIDAVETLAEKYRIDISAFSRSSQSKNTSFDARYYDILKDAAIFFYRNLRLHPDAMAYFQKRGIHLDVIKQFGLGFSSDAWAELLKHLSSKYNALDLEKVGLVIKNKDQERYYDRFRNRVMFPIINPKGKVIGFGGRVLDDSLPKYLNSPETDIFNKSKTLYGLNLAKNSLNEKKQLIIAEGYMDVISLHTHGFKNAVATLGTALTTDHARLMRRYADEIIICYDSDFAGQKAALRSVDVLNGIVDKVKIVVLGENLDPDDYLKKYGAQALKDKIEQAETAMTFKLNHLMHGFNLNDEQQKIEFLSKASLILSEIDNAFEKNFHVERLSHLLGVNKEMIAREVFKEGYNPKTQYGFYDKKKEELIPRIASDKKLFFENQLISHYMHHYKTMTHDQKSMIEQFTFSKELQDVFHFIHDYYQTHDTLNIQTIIENADISVSSHIVKMIHSTETAMDIEHAIANILIMNIDQDITHLTQALKTSENPTDIQKEIQSKRIMKQELTLKMRQRKLKN